MSQMLSRVEKFILGKEEEKVIGHSHFTVRLSICKTTSDTKSMGLEKKKKKQGT